MIPHIQIVVDFDKNDDSTCSVTFHSV